MGDLRKKYQPSGGKFYTADGSVVDYSKILKTNIDPMSNQFVMTYAHGAVHRDVIINATHYADAGTADILFLIECGDTLQSHMEWIVTAGAGARIRFYKNPVFTDPGTLITNTRLKTYSGKTTQTKIRVAPTIEGSSFGTLLKDQYNGGGGQGAGIRGGSSVHDDAEFLLELEGVYLLRITRLSSQIVGTEFEWYEVNPI